MNQLDVLAQHCDAVLLAEAIGWLHDYRKCSDEQLRAQAANLSGHQALPRDSLANYHPHLTSANLQLPVQSTSRTVTDLLDDGTWNHDLLGQFLSRCHNTAHFDKQDLENDYGKQNYPAVSNDNNVQISSPFGFERDVPGNLTNQLWGLPWNVLSGYANAQRGALQKTISNLFSQTIADTRRPINEVDLWNWGMLVGALYKAALAGALLMGSPPAARDLRWRLLGIRVNGLDYFLNVARIPDLLVKQELLADSLNRVRDLVEITYPLGSEVYRDENGSVYVVPDVSDLLERTDDNGTSLRTLILQEFAQGTVKSKPNLQLGGEMRPRLELEEHPWWGQDPDWPNSSNDKLPDISSFLTRKITSPANADEIRQYWQNVKATDICTGCSLRPQGPGKKAADRNVCDICEERRADRSQKWATSQPDQTIWTDEVADANGRLALIMGKFDLTYWLDGSLLESLLLIAPHDPQNTAGKPVTSKTPSFSRLRRIWETTRNFWHEAQAESLKRLSDDRRRLKIHLDAIPKLGPFHVYDLVVRPTNLSVVWVPPQNNNDGYLITADNLNYIARQLGAETGVYTDPATAAIFVEDYLREQFVEDARQPILHNPDALAGRGRANLIDGIHIQGVDYQENRYATAIPILAEPRSFMMIVPADKSLDVLRHIKEKYEREMGKVRNRLPLHLGCAYAHRRTPLRAVLEAGRAMLDYRSSAQPWKINSANQQNGEVILNLRRNSHHMRCQIPVVMGDGTKDRWYPYLFLETEGDDSKADEPNRRAINKVSRPIGNGQTVDCWIVHAADLRPGETIHLWPSTFDFEFLDTSARRFDVSYTHGRRRSPIKRNRPYLLDDLERFEELWRLIKEGLSTAQVKQLDGLIEAKREEWEQGTGDKGYCETFEQFVCDALKNAGWKKEKRKAGEVFEEFQRAALTGEVHDVLELYMEILKCKPEQDKREV